MNFGFFFSQKLGVVCLLWILPIITPRTNRIVSCHPQFPFSADRGVTHQEGELVVIDGGGGYRECRITDSTRKYTRVIGASDCQ